MPMHYVLSFSLLLLGVISGKINENDTYRKRFIVILFIFFGVLIGLRSEHVGNDTQEYICTFHSIATTDSISHFFWRFEIGYVVMNRLISYITKNPQIVLIVSSAITMTAFARFILRYSQNVWLSACLFYFMGYFGRSANTIRLCLAISFVLVAYDFLLTKKMAPFVAMVILASLFHQTAIIFLLAWIVKDMKLGVRNILIMLIIAITALWAFPLILKLSLVVFPTYEHYIDSVYLNAEIRLASIINFLVEMSVVIMIFASANQKILSKKTGKIRGDHEKTFVFSNANAEVLLLVGLFITLVSFRFNLLGRISLYFNVFSLVFVPNALKSLENSKVQRLLTFAVVISFFLYQTTVVILRPEWNTIYPYSMFIRGEN